MQDLKNMIRFHHKKEDGKWAKLASRLYAQHLTSILRHGLHPALGPEITRSEAMDKKQSMQMTRNDAPIVNL